jgi:hypothetical protein
VVPAFGGSKTSSTAYDLTEEQAVTRSTWPQQNPAPAAKTGDALRESGMAGTKIK